MYYEEMLLDQLTPVSIYHITKELFNNELSFLFESGVHSGEGSFSFMVVGELESITHLNGKSFYKNRDGKVEEINSNPLLFMKEYYKSIDKIKFKELSNSLKVPFVDGFIGYVGYDMIQEFEPKLKYSMSNLKDDVNIADLYFIRPKLTLCYSHKTNRLTLLTPIEEMANRFIEIEERLKSKIEYLELQKATVLEDGKFALSQNEFFEIIDKSKEMIKSGDIFQILISNRFTQKVDIDPFSFYRVLRTKNPSPYQFLLDFKDFSIVGSSPEVMVELKNSLITLRPIAGTRKRGKTPQKDIEMELELKSDTKEMAEHIMLVDLGRNDVGRVAKKGTVKVLELMRVEKYSHVMHLVSDISAELDEKYDMFDLFMATFTAGTMTGAPKIRAMELIAEFEKLKRSFYSGAIGYFGFNGDLDSAITIRTALIKDKTILIQAGAGVVADSKNELEFLEVKNKMGSLMSSLEALSSLK